MSPRIFEGQDREILYRFTFSDQEDLPGVGRIFNLMVEMTKEDLGSWVETKPGKLIKIPIDQPTGFPIIKCSAKVVD